MSGENIMLKPLRVLIIEDSPEDVELLMRDVGKAGYQPDYRVVETPAQLKAALEEGDWQLILSDFRLPAFTGMDALKIVLEHGQDIPFIIISGEISEEAAVEAMRAGARDFIMKGKTARLFPAIERELAEALERKKLRLAEELTEKQRAYTRRMEALETLSTGMAHEFNTILTGIIGFTQLVHRSLPATDPNKEYLAKILSAAERGSKLTSTFLEYGRKSPQHQRLKNLTELVEQLLPTLSWMLGNTVKIEADLERDGLEVSIDLLQMEQVLKTLVSNARDAMPDGGSITIATRRFSMDEQFTLAKGFGIPGEYALLTFRDTGCGMTPEVREKAFEPFFSTKASGSGMGLGLPLAYNTIKQHGGYITMDTEPGKGTTVTIFLPIHQPVSSP
jgi:signal transduction histidine kinase